MSIAFSQAVDSQLVTATSQTAVFGNNTTGSSLLIVYALTNGTFSTISDTLGNSWTKLYTDSSDANIGLWYAINQSSGGADTVTITQTNGDALEIAAIEITGQNSSPFDTYLDGQISSGTSVSIGPLTTNYSNELLLGLWANNDSPVNQVPGSGWTECYDPTGERFLFAMYQLQSSSGSYTATGTTASGGYSAGAIIAIRSSGGSGGATTSWLSINLNPTLKGAKH